MSNIQSIKEECETSKNETNGIKNSSTKLDASVSEYSQNSAPLEERVAAFLSSLGTSSALIVDKSSNSTENLHFYNKIKDNHLITVSNSPVIDNNIHITSSIAPEFDTQIKNFNMQNRKRALCEANQLNEHICDNPETFQKANITDTINLTKAFERPISPTITPGLTPGLTAPAAPAPEHLHHPQPQSQHTCQFKQQQHVQQQVQQQHVQQHLNNYSTNVDYGCYVMNVPTTSIPPMMKGTNIGTVNPCIKPHVIHNTIPNMTGSSESYQQSYQSSGLNKEIRDLEKDWETHIASMEQVLMANRSQGLPNGPISEEALQLLSQMISNLYGLNNKVLYSKLQNVLDIHRRNTERITRVFHGLTGVKRRRPNQ